MFKYLPMYKMMTDTIGRTTALLGHNRHATKGASDNHAFAHPFQHGHINLMHNGSLTTHYALTKETFTVDSEAICKAMSEQPAEELIPKLRGAFALVWVDEIEGTLNFVRNSERPLAIAINSKKNTIYWASEKDMLKWLLDRESLTTNPIDYDEIVELPTGEIWSFNIEKDSVNVKDMTKTKVELQPVYSYGNYGNGNSTVGKSRAGNTNRSLTTTPTKTTTNTQTSHSQSVKPTAQAVKDGLSKEEARYRHNNNTENRLRELTKKDIERVGRENVGFRTYISLIDNQSITELEERVGVLLSSLTCYNNGTAQHGQAYGRMVEFPYSRVTIHGIKRDMFEEYMKESDGLITAYLAGANIPAELASRRSLSLNELKEVTLTLRQDSVCEMRSLNEFMIENNPDPKVKELAEKGKKQ